jgi:hypothetical protein
MRPVAASPANLPLFFRAIVIVDWLFLLLLGLILFLVRDVLLLSSFRKRGSFLKAIAVYSGTFVALFALLGTAADFISREEALSLIGDVRLWLPAILLHAALWFGFFQAKRNPRSRLWSFALALVPAPVFVYCAGGLCWLTLSGNTAADGTTTGALLGTAWIAVTASGACWARRFATTESQARAVLDFAAAVNLSAILLLPLHQQSEQSALVESAFRGKTSAAALAATAGLIGASFLFHRMRRTP